MTFQLVLKVGARRSRTMSIDIDEALQQINLKTLADLSTYELQHRRCNSSVDDRYCVELFRRALVEQTESDGCAWPCSSACKISHRNTRHAHWKLLLVRCPQ